MRMLTVALASLVSLSLSFVLPPAAFSEPQVPSAVTADSEAPDGNDLHPLSDPSDEPGAADTSDGAAPTDLSEDGSTTGTPSGPGSTDTQTGSDEDEAVPEDSSDVDGTLPQPEQSAVPETPDSDEDSAQGIGDPAISTEPAEPTQPTDGPIEPGTDSTEPPADPADVELAQSAGDIAPQMAPAAAPRLARPNPAAFPVGTAPFRGTSRYDTAVKASRLLAPGGADHLFISANERYADQLSAAPALKKVGGVHLIVEPSRIPSVVEQEIRRLKPRNIYVIGGSSAVRKPVIDRLRALTGVQPQVFAGSSRIQTSRLLNERFFPGTVGTVVVANSTSDPDQLIGGVAAARRQGTMVLTAAGTLSEDARRSLASLRPGYVLLTGNSWPQALRTAISRAAGGAQVTVLSGRDRSRTSTAVVRYVWGSGAKTGFFSPSHSFADAASTAALAAIHSYPIVLTPSDCLMASAHSATTGFTKRVVFGSAQVLSALVPTKRCAAKATSSLGTYGHGKHRIDRGNPAAQAATIAQRMAREGSAAVFITSQDARLDQLVVAPAAKRVGATHLVVTKYGIPAETRAEIARQEPATIYIVGGTAAVSAAVQRDLGAITGSWMKRVAGTDRYETARLVALEFFNHREFCTVASGENGALPDQIVAANAAAHMNGPMLLTTRHLLSNATHNYFSLRGASEVTTIGGSFAGIVTGGLRDTTGLRSIGHIGGSDRTATSVNVLRTYWGQRPENIVYMPRDSFWDIAAVGQMGAMWDVPVVLSKATCTDGALQSAFHGQRRGFYVGSPDLVRLDASAVVCYVPPKFAWNVIEKGNYLSHGLGWDGQETNFWCGPAVGVTILWRLGFGHDQWGQRVTQGILARDEYMRTNSHGGTEFATQKMAVGIRNWSGGKVNYGQWRAPGTQGARDKIKDSFYTGRPVIMDTQEWANGPHMNNHPRATFDHIMAVDGYDRGNDNAGIVDPGARVLWPQSSPWFIYPTEGLGQFLNDFGIYY